ncbi:hypothetical protein GV828_09175 [Flavobacterium sp. NST-5]|uniref:Uncharacterized protein n=1 Tax=Flavobacterium ichthyis TaxID=2698827 RepID=A0ABW9ZDG9_9FLAO|nr:hypothetical protein [Flavobacterium ichthyis]NBL65367.1 hypothetical protein [Flavobacterium ichthyis]
MQISKILFLLFCCSVFGQQSNNFEISRFEKENEQVEILRNQFNFKADDTLICLNNSKCVLIGKDSIVLYKVKSGKVEFKERILKEKIHSTMDITPIFSLNPSELNVDEMDGKKISISDGAEYVIDIYKKDKHLKLVSHSPETYIANKYPFYQERKEFLNYYKSLENLFIDERFLELQSAKEIYIKYDKNNNSSKTLINRKDIVDESEIFFINELMFYNIGKTHKEIKLQNINPKLIVDYNYLNQYFTEELKKLLKENPKRIFLIEESSKAKKVIIQQVRLVN